jgi:CSLREA domain-containing protein
MRRSILIILLVAVLVLPAGSLGVAQEGSSQPETEAPGRGLAGGLRGVEGGEVEDYEPWVPPARDGPGAVITVTTTDDELNSDGDCALREAIQAANTDAAVDACVAGNGADTVVVPSGTYTLTISGAGENNNQTGDLDILDHLTLTGDGAGLTVLDGNNLDRVLHMWMGLTVEINALTITHGQVFETNGGGIFNQGTLTLNNVALLENTVVSNLKNGGGGLQIVASSLDSSATLNGCLVDGNEAPVGGGIANAIGTGLESTMTVNDSTVSNNTATMWAGGLSVANFSGAQNAAANLVVLNSTVEGNTAEAEGGGIVVIGRALDNVLTSLTVDHSTVSGNTSNTSTGGGIGAYNTAGNTPAVTVTVAHSTVEGNTANTAGGGIAALNFGAGSSGVTLTVDHSTIRGNTAAGTDSFTGRGGGLWVQNSQATLVASTVSGNTSSGNAYGSGFGGGLVILGSTAEVVNSTISGNQASGSSVPNASGFGGGVAAVGQYFPTTLALTNTTVAGNSSNVGGGGVVVANYGTDATITFKNSVVGDNSAPSGFGESCFTHDWGFGPGTFTSLGHNLEDYDTCELDQPSDWPDTDPLLGPLQDNGGPTWTHALLEGSLARDHGDDAACPPTDQRGVPRPQGPVSDIGAFEAYPDENAPAVMAVSPPDGALDVAVDAALVITFSEPISVPTFAYSVSPDPGGWAESWGPNDTVVSLTHDDFAYDTAYTATITAAEDRAGNPLAAPYAWSFSTVAEPCDPVETLTVEGPASLLVGETGVYSATYAPITATLPVTLTWEDGTVGATAAYSWTLPGTYTLTVTATNPCGEAVGRFPVEVSEEAIYWIFLPLVVKDMP